MGCSSSMQSVGDDYVHKAHENKVFGYLTTQYGSIDSAVLGNLRDRAFARPVFTLGKSAVCLITMPCRANADSDPNHNDEQRTDDDAEAAEGTLHAGEQKQVERVRWALYNDSKTESTVTVTFFHGEDIVSLHPAVTLEKLEGERVRAEITLKPVATELFVEGSITGYMWRCSMVTAEGTSEPATAVQVR